MQSRLFVFFAIMLSLFLSACASTQENPSRFAEPRPASPDNMVIPGRTSPASSRTDRNLPDESAEIQTFLYSRPRSSALTASASSSVPLVFMSGLGVFFGTTENKKPNFFIDPDKYTTDGVIYQQRYKRNLQGIINTLLKSDMVIKEQSVGFYFDKKSNNPQRLYVGLDLIVNDIAGADYGLRAKTALDKNLRYVMEAIHSQREFFKEEQIVGFVIGFVWTNANVNEQINIWIQSADAERYKNNELTYDETIQRSYLTNSQGRIIILK